MTIFYLWSKNAWIQITFSSFWRTLNIFNYLLNYTCLWKSSQVLRVELNEFWPLVQPPLRLRNRTRPTNKAPPAVVPPHFQGLYSPRFQHWRPVLRPCYLHTGIKHYVLVRQRVSPIWHVAALCSFSLIYVISLWWIHSNLFIQSNAARLLGIFQFWAVRNSIVWTV